LEVAAVLLFFLWETTFTSTLLAAVAAAGSLLLTFFRRNFWFSECRFLFSFSILFTYREILFIEKISDAFIQIHKFLGLPDPDPVIRGTDLDPSIIKQKKSENLDYYCFVTS
jgi:hypothetical protein